MYHARVETRAIAHDTCARMEPRASLKPVKLLHDEDLRDLQYHTRSNELGLSHPRSVVDPHERRAGVLMAQDDVDEAVNKAAYAQLEAETANKGDEKAERNANEVQQSNRELLERLRNLER